MANRFNIAKTPCFKTASPYAIRKVQAGVDARMAKGDSAAKALLLATEDYLLETKSALKAAQQQAKPERSAAQKANDERLRQERNTINPEKDDILVAISKLGGFRFAEVDSIAGKTLSESTQELNRRGVFGKPVIRKTGGIGLDKMRESLVGWGYLPADADINTLIDTLDAARTGNPQLSSAGDFSAEIATQEQQYYANLEQNDPIDLQDEELEQLGYNDVDEITLNIYERLVSELNDTAFIDNQLREYGDHKNAGFYEQAIPGILSEIERRRSVSPEPEMATGEDTGHDRQDDAHYEEQKSQREPEVEQTDAGDQYVFTKGETKPLEFGNKKPPAGAGSVSTGDLMDDMSGLQPQLFDGVQASSPSAEPASKGSDSSYGASNKLVTNERYEQLQAKMRAKLDQLNSGVDPELIAIGTEIAVYHIESGARSFAAFSKKVLADFGERAKPYLKSWYMGAKYFPGLNINAAFDALVGEIKTKETEQGVALYSRSGKSTGNTVEQVEAELQGFLGRGFKRLKEAGKLRVVETLDQEPSDALTSVTASTSVAYRSRIDELFSGGKPKIQGVKILDRSDVLGVMGYSEKPIFLVESKVIAGQDNHILTAEHWKKIPQWLEDPAMVFDSETQPGRLVFVAPETINGTPVVMIVEPGTKGNNVHILVNAYEKGGRTPVDRWMYEGLTRYFDKMKGPKILGAFRSRLTGLPKIMGHTKKIHQHSDLVKYRDNKKSVPLHSQNGDIAGFYQNGQITLIADQIIKGSAKYLMQHEGLHALMDADPVFSAKRTEILDQFEALRETSQKVRDAFARVPKDTSADKVVEEALAYYVQNPANHNTSIFRKLLAQVKAFLLRHGVHFKILSEDDLVALIQQGVRSFARKGVDTGLAFDTMVKTSRNRRHDAQRIPQAAEQASAGTDLGAAADHAGEVYRAVSPDESQLGASFVPSSLSEEHQRRIDRLKEQEFQALIDNGHEIPSSVFVSMWKSQGELGGIEHKVILSGDKKTIRKATPTTINFSVTDYLTRLKLHNYLFPGSRYTYRGVMDIDGVKHIVVDQPNVTNTQPVTQAEIDANLKNMGFEPRIRPQHKGKITELTEIATMYVNDSLGVIVWDVDSRNVVKVGSDLAYIDPMIELVRGAASDGVQNKPLFSVNESSAEDTPKLVPISQVEFDTVFDRVTARSKNRDGFVIAPTAEDLPTAIKKQADKEGIDYNKIDGVFHRGKVYIVRNNMASAAQLEEVLFHEWHGHAGLMAMMGNSGEVLNKELLELYDSLAPGEMQKLAKKYNFDLSSYAKGLFVAKHTPDERHAVLMQELLAHMTREFSTGKLSVKVKEIIGRIRAWLRRNGFAELSRLTDTDIALLLKKARAFAEAGTWAKDPGFIQLQGKELLDTLAKNGISKEMLQMMLAKSSFSFKEKGNNNDTKTLPAATGTTGQPTFPRQPGTDVYVYPLSRTEADQIRDEGGGGGLLYIGGYDAPGEKGWYLSEDNSASRTGREIQRVEGRTKVQLHSVLISGAPTLINPANFDVNEPAARFMLRAETGFVESFTEKLDKKLSWLEGWIPNRVKTAMASVLSNPHYGAKKSKWRGSAYDLNLERSAQRNEMQAELYEESEDFEGFDAVRQQYKKASKADRAAVDRLLVQGDRETIEYTQSEALEKHGATEAAWNIYMGVRRALDKSRELMLDRLGRLRLIAYEGSEYYDELIGLLDADVSEADLAKKFGINRPAVAAWRQVKRSERIINNALAEYRDAPFYQTLKGFFTSGQTVAQVRNLYAGTNKELVRSFTSVMKKINDEGHALKIAADFADKRWHGTLIELMAQGDEHPMLQKLEVYEAYLGVKEYDSQLNKLKNEWRKATGYLPRLRKDGDYHVRIRQIDRETGEFSVVWMQPAQTESGAKKMQATIDAAIKNGTLAEIIPASYDSALHYDSVVEPNTATREEIFMGMGSHRAIEALLGKVFDKSQDAGVIENVRKVQTQVLRILSDEISARGFGRHRIGRSDHLIEGYLEENTPQIVSQFIGGMTGWLSKAEFAARANKLVSEMPAEAVEDKTWVTDYVDDALRNSNAIDQAMGTARGAVAAMYLGFKMSSALLNATQNYVWGQALLSKDTKGAMGKLAKAQRDVLLNTLAKKKLTEEEEWALEQGIRRGRTQANYVRAIAGQDEGGGTVGKVQAGLRWATNISMIPFQLVETYWNREPALLAAFRVYRNEQGLSKEEALKKAEAFVDDVHFVIGKENMPALLRKMGAAGRMIYTFQSYSHNYLLGLATQARQGEYAVVLRSLTALVVLGGISALPFGDDLDKWYRRMFGERPLRMFEQWLRETSNEYTDFGDQLTDFIMHGAPAVGVGANFSNALAVRVPWFSAEDESLAERVGGVWGGLAQKATMATESLSKGDLYRASEFMAPEAVAAALRGYRMYADGATTMSGRPVFDKTGQQARYSGKEAVLRALGLMPLGPSKQTQDRWDARTAKQFWQEKKGDILAKWRAAKTVDERKKVMKEIRTFNLSLREHKGGLLVAPITEKTRIQAMRARADRRELAYLN